MAEPEPQSDGSECDPALQAMVSAARSVSVSDEVVERIEQRALALASVAKRPNGVGHGRSGWFRKLVIPGSVAASALIAVALVWQPFMQASAWAQVVRAVSAKPWMRLTLQKPDVELPDGEKSPDVVIWLDGDRRTAALAAGDESRWIDLSSSETFCFDAETGRIKIGKLEDPESAEVRTLLMVLDRFDAVVTLPGGSPVRFIGSSRDEVTIDGQTFDEFSFRFEYAPAAPARSTMAVLVDKETNRPMRLTIYRGEKSDKLPSPVFAIDYPDSGPADIYALGVPRDAPVDDVRALAEFFSPRSPGEPDDYEAMELMFVSGKERRFLSEACRYRMKAGSVIAENVDMDQVLKLSDKVYFDGGDVPTGNTPTISWWVDEASRLEFDRVEMRGSNLPHNRCYMPYGGVGLYRSKHESILEGLEGTIELRGPKQSVWLDPGRDMIVRRYEYVDDDGSITVWQYDEVVQDSKGTWFAKQWRSGRVCERGAALSDKAAGVSTTVHISDIKFQ